MSRRLGDTTWVPTVWTAADTTAGVLFFVFFLRNALGWDLEEPSRSPLELFMVHSTLAPQSRDVGGHRAARDRPRRGALGWPSGNAT